MLLELVIEGELRLGLVTMEWVIVFLCLEITLMFYFKTKKKEKIQKNFQERAYFWFFLGYAIMWICLILYDYYAETRSTQLFVYNIGIIVRQICVFLFFYRMEKELIVWKKHFFTIICLITIILDLYFIIFLIEKSEFAGSLFFWALIVPFFILYLYGIQKNKQIRKIPKEFKKIIYPCFIGFAILFIGHAFSKLSFLTFLGLSLRMMGDIFQIGGLIVLVLFLPSVPSMSEFSWDTKIEQLFVILKSGTCIYHRSFKDLTQIIGEQIESDTINSLNSMFRDLSDKENLSIIEKKGNIFMFQPGKFVYGVLICSEELFSLKVLLNRFIDKVEDLYRDILKDIDAGMKVFEPIDSITKEIFY